MARQENLTSTIACAHDDNRFRQALTDMTDYFTKHSRTDTLTVLPELEAGIDYIVPRDSAEPEHVLNPDWLRGAALEVYRHCIAAGLTPHLDYRISVDGKESFALTVFKQRHPALLSGRPVARRILQEAAPLVRGLQLRPHPHNPCLCIVHVGTNPDDISYQKEIDKQAEFLGIKVTKICLPTMPNAEQLEELLHKINHDSSIDAVLVQTIRDKELNDLIRRTLSRNKDPEHITNFFMGKNIASMPGEHTYAPATAMACLLLIKEVFPNLGGVRVVINNDTAVIGRPLANLLFNERACPDYHNKMLDPGKRARSMKDADVIVTATPVPNMFGPDDVSKGVTIIDVAIIREGNTVHGNVNTDAFLDVASHITPVPGGVGPVTVALLLDSVIRLAVAHHSRHGNCSSGKAA
jgi:methylenetetrahydrofolate dehydrogenase (NADP+)/methenyltetrahydrofolate cyclohydrolase